MSRCRVVFLGFTVLSMVGSSQGDAIAEEGKFDAQVFRPSGAPRDLMVVQKTEVIGHMSPTFGFFSDFSLDPLVLINNVTTQDIEAVGARLQLVGSAGIGLFDVIDLQLTVPFVAWQASDNLRPLGSEGEIESASVGDIRLSGRMSLGFIPQLKRLGDKGFAMAIRGEINLPSGNMDAFTSDGVITGAAGILADYRLPSGGIISANLGVWFRPEREFAGIRIGDMASFGLAAETYVKRSWGLSILGGVYGYPSLYKFPDSARQIPLEAFLGLRRQTGYGITWTFGGSFGTACSFGKPAFRLFSGVTWTPSSSREQEEIDRILRRNDLDPDRDGVISEQDECPAVAGSLENRGCPDTDRDGDGWVDRVDECPELASNERGKKGCPPAYIRGDEIIILEKVKFATDSHAVLPESLLLLADVARVLQAHPEVQRVNIEAHTDIRSRRGKNLQDDSYNKRLSQRRVNSVTSFLVGQGIDPRRLEGKGYGHSRPLVDDTPCNAPDEQLGPECKLLTSINRRVVFRIAHRCAALGKASQNTDVCPRARIEGDKIIVLDKVRFEPQSHVIPRDSRPILNEVAAVLLAHPELEKVRIEGHTNILASEPDDRRLSKRRAAAIRAYLIERGVAKSRLDAKGYGHGTPKYEDADCKEPGKSQSLYCQFVLYKNDRFTFRIVRWGVRSPGNINQRPTEGRRRMQLGPRTK